MSMAGPPSQRLSFHSASGEPSLRRLGVGSGGADRPVRAQIVVALVVALALVAVPLYMMRRPSPEKKAEAEAAAAASASAAPAFSARAREPLDAGKPPERLRLAPPQRVRCGAGPKGGQEGNFCDQLAPLEEALAKTIRENEGCAPRMKEAGTINYVLTVDFSKRSYHIFPGASGDFHGPQARRATTCVMRALPKPDWDGIRHQFRHYSIAILATYVPEGLTTSPTAPPKFE
jgi:hypothetical protein